MAKPQMSFRAPQPTKDAVEEYAEEHDITQSDAARRLIERGLDYERGRLTVEDNQEREATDAVLFLSELVRVFRAGVWVSVAAGLLLGLAAFIVPPALGYAMLSFQAGALFFLAVTAAYSRIAQIRKRTEGVGYLEQARARISLHTPDDDVSTDEVSG